MVHQMRIDKLKSAVKAAGVAMAPAADQFNAEPERHSAPPAVDPGNYSRSWATPTYRVGFDQAITQPNKLKGWFSMRWPRLLAP
jgi:hypothetical protein